MHRFTAKTLVAVFLTGLAAAGASLPAQAKSSRPEHRGGKKALGTVVSFDAATSILVVELNGGDELTAPVDPDAQVKLQHRGRAKQKAGRSHGNPTRGSLDDLLAGASVLRLKLEDDVVTKIRLRAAPAEAPVEADAPQDGTGDDTDDVEDDGSDEGSDDENPDDDDSGEPEDAIPPLPAP